MMFNLFKKKNVETDIYSPISGEIKELSTALDPVFREKMMGDGFYIIPKSTVVYSPIRGKIDSIFPTKHALTIKAENGINILIHIGTNTIELDGEPFELLTEENKIVERGDALVSCDFDYILSKNKGNEVYVIFPELDTSKSVDLVTVGNVTEKDIVAKI